MKEKKEKKQLNEKEVAILAARLRKQVILTFLSFAVSLSMLVVSSVAWFSNNHKADGSDMQMTIEASPNLIIGTTVSAISGAIVNLDEKTSVTFSDLPQTMRPATHSDSSATGLEYNTNPDAVSCSTGEAKSSAEALTFADVAETGAGLYYYDYTVYLASAGKELDAQELTAKLSYNVVPEYVADHFNAASADFYLNGVYVATDNLKDKNNAASAAAISAVVLTSGGIQIPYNQAETDNYWTVTIRVYFDGALEKESGQTYVYSNNLSPSMLNMKVDFNAVEPAG